MGPKRQLAFPNAYCFSESPLAPESLVETRKARRRPGAITQRGAKMFHKIRLGQANQEREYSGPKIRCARLLQLYSLCRRAYAASRSWLRHTTPTATVQPSYSTPRNLSTKYKQQKSFNTPWWHVSQCHPKISSPSCSVCNSGRKENREELNATRSTKC